MEKNLATLFQNRTFIHRNRVGVTYKSEDRWIPLTWEQIGHRVERIGRALIRLKIAPGDKVAIYSGNRPEWIIADLAILSIGAVSVPIYPNVTVEQAKAILQHSESKVVFVSNPEGTKLLKASGFDSLSWGIWFDAEETFPDSKHHLLSTFEKGAEDVDPVLFYDRIAAVSPTDLATLIYTSGTTGEPKGVMLTHQNILSNVIASAQVFPIGEDDHALSFLPLSHALERTAGFYTMMYVGAKVSFAESLAKVGQNLKEAKPTIIVSVPRILEKMYMKFHTEIASKSKIAQFLFNSSSKNKKGSILRGELGGNLKYIVCGGAAMNPKIALFFKDLGLQVLEGYGLTETAPVAAVNLPKENRIGTVGKPLPGVEILLADDGEVLIKGPNVMVGYFKDEIATRAAFTEHGYFKSGDIGVWENGYLKLTDRKKEILVTSGGKNIAPTPIENNLKGNPLIEHACIVGDGEKYIAALIVPNFLLLESKAKNAKISFQTKEELLQNEQVRKWYQAIVDEVNKELASFEAIKRFELLPNEFSVESGEITPTLKPKRKVILEKYHETIRKLFE